MKLRSKTPLSSSLDSFPQIASVTVTVVGALVLVGWMLDIPTLKSVLRGLVTMKAKTDLAPMAAVTWLRRMSPRNRSVPKPHERVADLFQEEQGSY